MKNLLALSLLFACVAGYSQGLSRHKTPKKTKDENVLDITKNQGTFLEYITPSEVKSEFEKEANLKLFTPEKRQTELNDLPKGGKLVLKFSRLTIEAANSKWFTIIAQDPQGKEVFREQLDSKVPDYMSGGGVSYWKNIRVVYLPLELPTGSKVFIVDGLENNRHEYLINN